MKRVLLLSGFLLLFAFEILAVYFIMPFPGSQKQQSTGLAYWFHNNIIWLRMAALLLLAYPVFLVVRHSGRWKKFSVFFALGVYAVLFFLFNFLFRADKMFYQPRQKNMAGAAANVIAPDKLVLGVTVNGESRAYPIQLIGYHHQVRDTVGGVPVLVTYCTVCRSGRVFSPEVNGKPETFRLVGMNHFNALFEDERTGSWWQQATGKAIAGPLKGSSLREFPSRQMTLASWLRAHPASLVMQPDDDFMEKYIDLEGYDKGTVDNSLEGRDSLSWKEKSWVLGIAHGGHAKAYDWNDLVREKLIEDSLPHLPVVILLEQDGASFHVWNRKLDTTVFRFKKIPGSDLFKDINTSSTWNSQGRSIDGPLKGRSLETVQAYQEFWHSWRTFHPGTKWYE